MPIESSQKLANLFVINRSSGELDWVFPWIYTCLRQNRRVVLLFIRLVEYDYFIKMRSAFESSEMDLMQVFCIEGGLYPNDSFPLSRKLILSCLRPIARLLAGLGPALPGYLRRYVLCLFLPQIEGGTILFVDNSFYKDLERGFLLPQIIIESIKIEKLIIFPHAPLPVGIIDNSVERAVDSRGRPETWFWKKYESVAVVTQMVVDNERTASRLAPRYLDKENVGCPRFQGWWLDQIPDAQLKNSGGVIPQTEILVLTKTRDRLGKLSPKEPLQQIYEILMCLEKMGVSWRIKMHPKDDREGLAAIVEEISGKSLSAVQADESVLELKGRYKACVAVPNSAVLDTVACGIPTVVFFDYSVVPPDVLSLFGGTIAYGVADNCCSAQELRDWLEDILADRSKVLKSQHMAFEKLYNPSADSRVFLSKLNNP